MAIQPLNQALKRFSQEAASHFGEASDFDGSELRIGKSKCGLQLRSRFDWCKACANRHKKTMFGGFSGESGEPETADGAYKACPNSVNRQSECGHFKIGKLSDIFKKQVVPSDRTALAHAL